jgi:hypothetical protein
MMVPDSQFTPFCDWEENPTVDDERGKGNDLRVPRRHKQIAHPIDRIDIRPVKGQIEEAHASKSRANEVCNTTSWCNPAEKRKRREKGEDELWEELPQRDTKNHGEKYNRLSS